MIQTCMCLQWHDDKGLLEHIHYQDEQTPALHNILARKHAKKLTAKSTYIVATFTMEPCLLQVTTRAQVKHK